MQTSRLFFSARVSYSSIWLPWAVVAHKNIIILTKKTEYLHYYHLLRSHCAPLSATNIRTGGNAGESEGIAVQTRVCTSVSFDLLGPELKMSSPQAQQVWDFHTYVWGIPVAARYCATWLYKQIKLTRVSVAGHISSVFKHIILCNTEQVNRCKALSFCFKEQFECLWLDKQDDVISIVLGPWWSFGYSVDIHTVWKYHPLLKLFPGVVWNFWVSVQAKGTWKFVGACLCNYAHYQKGETEVLHVMNVLSCMNDDVM